MNNLTHGFNTVMSEFLKDNNLEIISISEPPIRRVLIQSKFGIHDCPISTLNEYRIPDINSSINKDLYLRNFLYDMYNGEFDFSKVKYCSNNEIITIICDQCGEVEVRLAYLKKGLGCIKCNKNNRILGFDINKFKEKAINTHGDKFNYDNTRYIKSEGKVTIVCKIHGEFKQTPHSHISGRGCRDCKYENNFFTRSGWINGGIDSKGFDSYKLYIIRCFNDNEEFVKIGKTYMQVSRRYSSKILMPYEYEVIKIIEGSGNFIYNLETLAHRVYRDSRYKPKIYFGGERECYDKEILSKLNLLQVYRKPI